MTKTEFIYSRTGLPERSIDSTVSLLEDGATIPFIARYRKEMTGNLDEVQIGEVVKLKSEFETLEKRKAAILKTLTDQDVLTPELKHKIEVASDLLSVEDLYLPFKKRRKTRADAARERGLEPLAKILMAQNYSDITVAAAKFVKKDVNSVDEALAGALDIAAEWINENEYVRARLRKMFFHKAVITAKIVKKIKEENETAQKYRQYFDWEERLKTAPSHRLLAMLRAEKEGVIKLKVGINKEEAINSIAHVIVRKKGNPNFAHLELAIEDSYKRLLLPALVNEALLEARLRAEGEAIKVFADNLKQLLLAPPLGEKRILAIDPGFRSGCKVVCLDEKGDLLHNETIFPHPPQRETSMAGKKIKSLVNAYGIQAISIGNGTASRETEFFIKKIAFGREIQVFIVSEAGASVYSASKIARAEFPNFDVTVRGAVSIGRRLADPLAELVKIDPKAIGVGQYQHDVDQVELKRELDRVVASCVNEIGVNVNTASAPLLAQVSGIGSTLADNIIKYRSENAGLKSRQELLRVPRLGAKVFEQAAAFLRVKNSSNLLDVSSVHPESYSVVEEMAADLEVGLEDLIGNKDLIKQIEIEKYVTDKIGIPTLTDIVSELEKPGVDPRKSAKIFEFDPSVRSIQDLKAGMVLSGIVNNITNFGCFVDIGIKESGLVHISRLSKSYVNDVSAIVKLQQHVQVEVLEVDEARKRIQLSLVSSSLKMK